MEKQPNRTAAKKIFHVVGLLALALVSVYIIVQCFVIFRRSYKTETAIKYTLAESITLDGVVAFDSVDVAGSGDLGYLVQDGERVTEPPWPKCTPMIPRDCSASGLTGSSAPSRC